MATFNAFNAFANHLARGYHDFHATAAADTLRIYLSNTAPSASGDNDKADLAEIANGNGYATGGQDVGNAISWTAATDVAAITSATGLSWTATGGAIASFRYVVLYNDTHASNILIGWWDYGSQVALAAGESFTVDFGTSLFTITV